MKKVVIMCSGLGHINRGYESFSKEIFEELLSKKIYDIYLIKGAGSSSGKEIWSGCIKRTSKLASILSKITGKSGYDIEQYSFFASSISKITSIKPDVIIYSDFILGVFLWYLRKYLNLKYKLLFSNGAPNGPPFTRCDFVQQLLPCHFNTAVAGGTSESMQAIIPYGLKIKQSELSTLPDKIGIRKLLNIPVDKKIIISVGAVNETHKRMKYLIKEFSALQDKGYYLLILGQETSETNAVKELAAKLLKAGLYSIKSVMQEEVHSYYQSSDIFVLCSLSEGLPRVSIEAMSHGLPIFIHDYEIARETLGMDAFYINMENERALTKAILDFKDENLNSQKQKMKAFEKYSWEKLLPSYIHMINKVADK